MNNDLGALTVLAEVSVAFSGFAALLAAIRVNQAVRALYRAAIVVQIGFIVLLGSLVPLVLAELGADGAFLWRLTSASTVVLILRFLFFVMRRDHAMTQAGAPPDAPRSLYVSLGLFWLALIVSLANLTGWPSPPSIDLHLAALLILFAPGIETMVVSFAATADGAIGALSRNNT